MSSITVATITINNNNKNYKENCTIVEYIYDNIVALNKRGIKFRFVKKSIRMCARLIIENNTYDNLLNLLIEYPISITNDQGIIALYFTNIKPLFKQIKTHNEILYFYDYLSRNKNNKYIMLKSI